MRLTLKAKRLKERGQQNKHGEFSKGKGGLLTVGREDRAHQSGAETDPQATRDRFDETLTLLDLDSSQSPRNEAVLRERERLEDVFSMRCEEAMRGSERDAAARLGISKTRLRRLRQAITETCAPLPEAPCLEDWLPEVRKRTGGDFLRAIAEVLKLKTVYIPGRDDYGTLLGKRKGFYDVVLADNDRRVLVPKVLPWWQPMYDAAAKRAMSSPAVKRILGSEAQKESIS